MTLRGDRGFVRLQGTAVALFLQLPALLAAQPTAKSAAEIAAIWDNAIAQFPKRDVELRSESVTLFQGKVFAKNDVLIRRVGKLHLYKTHDLNFDNSDKLTYHSTAIYGVNEKYAFEIEQELTGQQATLALPPFVMIKYDAHLKGDAPAFANTKYHVDQRYIMYPALHFRDKWLPEWFREDGFSITKTSQEGNRCRIDFSCTGAAAKVTPPTNRIVRTGSILCKPAREYLRLFRHFYG